MRNGTRPKHEATALPPVASLSKRDYAQHQSVSERTVDHWRAAGMPCLVISTRKVLFPVADCDRWLRDRFLVVRGPKGGAA